MECSARGVAVAEEEGAEGSAAVRAKVHPGEDTVRVTGDSRDTFSFILSQACGARWGQAALNSHSRHQPPLPSVLTTTSPPGTLYLMDFRL